MKIVIYLTKNRNHQFLLTKISIDCKNNLKIFKPNKINTKDLKKKVLQLKETILMKVQKIQKQLVLKKKVSLLITLVLKSLKKNPQFKAVKKQGY